MVTTLQKEVIKRSQQSVVWFLTHFGKVKHPAAGIVGFKPFGYQRHAIQCFRKHRFNIFKKCRQCFPDGSQVWTPTGATAIEDIKPGNVVFSYNGDNITPVAVTERFYNGISSDLIEVCLTDGRRTTATGDHEFLTLQGYKQANQLTTADQLVSYANLSPEFPRVAELRRSAESRRVYDLSVPPYHNYLVDGHAVHNCGISKISGAFALWYAMFNSYKTILIVSRTDLDAMNFLRDNVVFLYNNLPEWMKELWKPVKQDMHEIVFPNGSTIRSLTSHPDVLRSNASSLNIIDEAAFIQGMDVMWASGWPTMQHGGACIVVSTTCGIGNWYWSTWTDAEAGASPFNPILVNWWDMDWIIEYNDPLSLERCRIAPKDGIRKCDTPDELEKYGPYWSPWLEDQYRALQEKGEAWKFEQEVLASFVGSGNTVISKQALLYTSTTINDDYEKISGVQAYVHPVSGEQFNLDFTFRSPDEGFWVWEEPVVSKPAKLRGNKLIEAGEPAHSYVIGIDIATGKGKDYHAIEVLDVDSIEQVAELMIRCLPRELVRFIDRIGRWYNSALLVVERNNGGDLLIDELRHGVMYPRIWRKKNINDKPRPKARSAQRPLQMAHYGFFTSQSTKAMLNKLLIDGVRSEGGWKINSRRLHKQLSTYVRKKDRLGRDTMKTEAEEGVSNYDDLVMSFALALMGAADALVFDSSTLMPTHSGNDFKNQQGPTLLTGPQMVKTQQDFLEHGGAGLIMPMGVPVQETLETNVQRELDNYTLQLGAIPINQGKPLITPPKYYFQRKS